MAGDCESASEPCPLAGHFLRRDAVGGHQRLPLPTDAARGRPLQRHDADPPLGASAPAGLGGDVQHT
eukprot:2324512-Pyramimonas_sp.AAC.1